MIINVQALDKDAIIPQYKTKGAAGFDFHALNETLLYAGEWTQVRTGVAFEIPEGYELEIRGRSGLAFNENIIAFNGTIDSDYRGEIKLLLKFDEKDGYLRRIKKGERVAQGIIKKVEQATFEPVLFLTETERGDGAFGSTGK